MNLNMQLRKASSHAMLFRTNYCEGAVHDASQILAQELEFNINSASASEIELELLTKSDAELHQLFSKYEVCFHRSKPSKSVSTFLEFFSQQKTY